MAENSQNVIKDINPYSQEAQQTLGMIIAETHTKTQ